MDVFVLSQMFEPNSVVGVPVGYLHAVDIKQAIEKYVRFMKTNFPDDVLTVNHESWNPVRAEITTTNEDRSFMFAIFKVDSWEE